MGSDDSNEDPVVAYALATGALLAAASLMCVVLMCCAKWYGTIDHDCWSLLTFAFTVFF